MPDKKQEKIIKLESDDTLSTKEYVQQSKLDLIQLRFQKIQVREDLFQEQQNLDSVLAELEAIEQIQKLSHQSEVEAIELEQLQMRKQEVQQTAQTVKFNLSKVKKSLGLS